MCTYMCVYIYVYGFVPWVHTGMTAKLIKSAFVKVRPRIKNLYYEM